jgi:hypothetical protein
MSGNKWMYKKIFRQNLEEFKEACNHYDKLKEHKDEDSAGRNCCLKWNYTLILWRTNVTGDHKTDGCYKTAYWNWKTSEKILFQRHISENSIKFWCDFWQIKFEQEDTDMIRFANRMDSLKTTTLEN